TQCIPVFGMICNTSTGGPISSGCGCNRILNSIILRGNSAFLELGVNLALLALQSFMNFFARGETPSINSLMISPEPAAIHPGDWYLGRYPRSTLPAESNTAISKDTSTARAIN